jgi:hypothetical protein
MDRIVKHFFFGYVIILNNKNSKNSDHHDIPLSNLLSRPDKSTTSSITGTMVNNSNNSIKTSHTEKHGVMRELSFIPKSDKFGISCENGIMVLITLPSSLGSLSNDTIALSDSIVLLLNLFKKTLYSSRLLKFLDRAFEI